MLLLLLTLQICNAHSGSDPGVTISGLKNVVEASFRFRFHLKKPGIKRYFHIS